MERRILVTGAGGFIGRQLLPLLIDAGYEVHAVSSRAAVVEAGAQWHQADLLDPSQSDRLIDAVAPSHLMHLAWYMVPGQVWEAEANQAWVEASLRLVRRFAARGGRRAVFAGSCAEYDERDGRCSEATTPCQPKSFYGKCKLSLWQAVADYARVAGFAAAWGRVFHLYGPHEHVSRLVPALTLSCLAGRPAPATSGVQRRDFLHAHDAARAFVAIVESALSGAVNIGSGVAVSIREIAILIGELTGRGDLIRLGSLPDRPGEAPLLYADNDRLSATGWRPVHQLRQGLADTIAWWRGESRRLAGPDDDIRPSSGFVSKQEQEP